MTLFFAELKPEFANLRVKFADLSGIFANLDLLFADLSDVFADLKISGFRNLRPVFERPEGRFPQLEPPFERLEARLEQLEGQFPRLEKKATGTPKTSCGGSDSTGYVHCPSSNRRASPRLPDTSPRALFINLSKSKHGTRLGGAGANHALMNRPGIHIIVIVLFVK